MRPFTRKNSEHLQSHIARYGAKSTFANVAINPADSEEMKYTNAAQVMAACNTLVSTGKEGDVLAVRTKWNGKVRATTRKSSTENTKTSAFRFPSLQKYLEKKTKREEQAGVNQVEAACQIFMAHPSKALQAAAKEVLKHRVGNAIVCNPASTQAMSALNREIAELKKANALRG